MLSFLIYGETQEIYMTRRMWIDFAQFIEIPCNVRDTWHSSIMSFPHHLSLTCHTSLTQHLSLTNHLSLTHHLSFTRHIWWVRDRWCVSDTWWVIDRWWVHDRWWWVVTDMSLTCHSPETCRSLSCGHGCPVCHQRCTWHPSLRPRRGTAFHWAPEVTPAVTSQWPLTDLTMTSHWSHSDLKLISQWPQTSLVYPGSWDGPRIRLGDALSMLPPGGLTPE